jgi:1-acyl-sn-glycerol-3-phosphate acyltransferase
MVQPADYLVISREGSPLPIRALLFCYRWLVVIPVLVLTVLVHCSVIIILAMIGFPSFANTVVGRNWARVNAFFSGIKLEVEGQEKVDPNQSYIVVANHRSLVDIYLVYGAAGIDLKWVMKKELRAIPIFGLACEKLGHVVVDRSNTEADLKSMQAARSSLVNGKSIFFFAEGTRSRDEAMLPFKKGAFRMALDLKLPVLPASIHGTREILPRDTTQLFPGTARLVFHDPIATEQMNPNSTSALMQQTRSVLLNAMQEE